MHFVDLLSMSFTATGAVLGLAVGVLAVLGLHWLLPEVNLRVVEALLVAAAFLLGAILGSRLDLKRD
jgi:multisubunit Na+/H+ antiporter MnhE subunit